MLNYANLNDMEFEALCQDVMSRILGIPLRRFAPGRDGGVDLTDDAARRNIIVQVKHYTSSTSAALIRVLKSELEKVERLVPKKYYICCSKQLSPDNIRELYDHFRDYMDSAAHIVTLTEIDDFLKAPENRDILKKHFKLWLDDMGILEELYNDEIFVDCEALLADVEARQHRFVQTRAFDKALAILEKGRTLCIIGDPGVGKSFTSQMLVLHHAALGYRVRYTTEVTDLGSLKKSLHQDKDAREIILLDDCFGQAYFDMKSSQSTALVSLIRYVRLHPNKRLILNSRVTIFQEARARQQVLDESLERKEFQVHVLDMNQLSDEEKAKILYNHLYFSGIPSDYFDDVRKDRRYWQIIRHPNYNPRLIEFVCRPSQYKAVQPGQFFDFIDKHLDNPQQIWADEYDNRLQRPDRLLLQTIYSLTNTSVSAELVRQCFNRRLAALPGIDDTLNQYKRSLQRLNDSFVRQLDQKGELYLSMLNPSVNDFLRNRLRPGQAEHDALLDSICCEKQILRLLPEEERLPYAVELVKSGRIEHFVFEEAYQQTRFIARCILAAGLCLEQYRKEVQEFLVCRVHFGSQSISFGNGFVSIGPIDPVKGALNHWYRTYFQERQQIIAVLKNSVFWKFYHLRQLLSQPDAVYHLLRQFDLEDAVKLINVLDARFSRNVPPFFVRDVETYLQEVIGQLCDMDCGNLYDAANYLDINAAKHASTRQSAIMDAAAQIESDASADIESHLWCHLFDLPDRFCHFSSEIPQANITGAQELVEAYVDAMLEEEAEEEWDEEWEDDEDVYAAPMDPIDAIFQR